MFFLCLRSPDGIVSIPVLISRYACDYTIASCRISCILFFSTFFASVVLWIVRGAAFRHASFAHECRGSVYSICVRQLCLCPFALRERFKTCSTLYHRLTILSQKSHVLQGILQFRVSVFRSCKSRILYKEFWNYAIKRNSVV